MNILTTKPPEILKIHSRDYPIHWEFQTGIQISLLWDDGQKTPDQKFRDTLSLYFPDKIPIDLNAAFLAAMEFYRAGEKPEEASRADKNQPDLLYSFEEDAPYIYGAFYSAYGIDLSKVKLHWWTFRALFRCLPEDTLFQKIMGYRAVRMSDVPQADKKRIQKLKEHYALKNKKARAAMSLAEREARMLAHVDRCFHNTPRA